MTEPTDPVPESPSPAHSVEINVQALHEALMREQTDPRDGFEPIPFWMAIIFAGLLFWGGLYLGSNSGNYRFDIFDSPDPWNGSGSSSVKPEEIPKDEAGLQKLGQRIFLNCAGCHQTTGLGGNGIPPLANSDWVAGEKTSAARLSRILLFGLKDDLFVNGQKFNGQMPAWGAQLKDYQIAAVLTYIRKEWGNIAPPIFPAEVTAAREKMSGRAMNGSQPFTQTELEAIPVEYVEVKRPEPKDENAKKDAPQLK